MQAEMMGTDTIARLSTDLVFRRKEAEEASDVSQRGLRRTPSVVFGSKAGEGYRQRVLELESLVGQ
jgi:hypothetical protein